MKNYIFLISGAPGSGKSTISKALLQHFDKGVYLSLDDFRKFVVSGFAPPVPSTVLAEEQAMLAYKNAVNSANNYYKEGYTVVLDEVASSTDTIMSLLNKPLAFKSILLLPDIEVNIQRNISRDNKSFDSSILNDFISDFSEKMHKSKDQWDIVIDNSNDTIEESVNKILRTLRK